MFKFQIGDYVTDKIHKGFVIGRDYINTGNSVSLELYVIKFELPAYACLSIGDYFDASRCLPRGPEHLELVNKKSIFVDPSMD